jgi:hypothetical protein
VKGITGESFVPESLILPQGIPALYDDPGSRTAILATLSTFDESGVAVRQTGGRDPHHGFGSPMCRLEAPRLPAWLPAPPPWLLVPPPRPPALGQGQRGCWQFLRPRWHRGVGGREATPTAPRRRVIYLGPPRSVRGLLVGPMRPAPKPKAHRGASVLRHHHHRVRHHHNHHHRRVRRRHHHLGVISPRGTSNSSSNKSSGRPASRVAGKSRAPSECNPLFH